MFQFCRWRMVMVLVAPIVVSNEIRADEYPEPYDGLKASEDAHRYYDARRQEAIKRQLNTIEWTRWWAGLPASPRPDTMYYRDPPNLDYIYATNRWSRFARSGRPGSIYRADIFEPWPLVPGDIYAAPFFFPVPQPIGRREIQTGPNRWESHPIFEHDRLPPSELEPPAPPTPAPSPKPTGPRRF